MAVYSIDADALKKAFLCGAAALDAKKEWINELNVFPVPDGDTGTNMTMTIMSAAAEVSRLENPDMAALTRTVSSGSLRGARGNSGVILSQLLSGFCKQVMNEEKIDSILLASAFSRAVEKAYKAVMKPKEGTILTVAKAMSDTAVKLAADGTDDLEVLLDAVVAEGEETLAHTPDMLPVLKQAGVVDSGGQGLMVAFSAAVDSLLGRETKYSASAIRTCGNDRPAEGKGGEEEIRFGYCTEFIIESEIGEEEQAEFRQFLDSMGDSIVYVADEDVVKVHVHTNDPGAVLSRAVNFGQLTRIKIDNMREEHNEVLRREIEKEITEKKETSDVGRKPYGFISVSSGEGLSEIFRSIGADYVIEGGQTMNPSTEDILGAIRRVNADVIYIFPNNKNIILAANQAAELTEDKRVLVLHAKTIPQGITAMVCFEPEASPDSNFETMTEAMRSIRSAEVTYAVRDTCIDGFDVKEGDIIAIGDGSMLASDRNLEAAVSGAVEQMVDEDSSVISLYYGCDVDEEKAKEISSVIAEKYPDCDVEVYSGGQPVYYFIISVE